MNERYTDAWGQEVEKDDKTDWSDYEPWQYWKNGYEWIECHGELEEQDMIAFRDDVQIIHDDGSKTYIYAERFIIGRIAGIDEDQDRIFIEIVHCEGEAAYHPEDKIHRAKKWLIRYGVYRWPRDHSPRENRTEQQIMEHGMDKEKRREEGKPINNWEGREEQGGSRFLDMHKKSSTNFSKSSDKHKKIIDQFKMNR